MSFTGKFKLVKSENFDEYLKKLDVGFVTRKMAASALPIQEIKIEGDEWTLKTTTTFKTTEIKFKLGEEFEEERADGVRVKTVVTLEDNKLVQKQKGPVDTTITRELTDTGLKMR